MGTTVAAIAITLDANGQAFWSWLMGFVGYVQINYGIILIPSWKQIATPGLNSNNPQEVDEFYVFAPQFAKYGPFYVGQAMQAIFGNDYASLASIVLMTMAWPSAAPRPLSSMVQPAVVPVVPTPPSNPIGNSFTEINGEVDYVDLGSPSIAVGGIYTAADGTKYVKQGRSTPFGLSTWFIKAAMVMLAVLASLMPAKAQVTVAASPQPMSVMSTLHVRTVGMWTVFIENNGPAARTLAAEDLYIALLNLRPVDPANAAIVLGDQVSRSAGARIVRVLTMAGQATAIGLAFASKSNAAWAAGLGLGSAALPQVITIAQGATPTAAPFLGSILNTPITLGPGQAITRTIFCDKTKAPAPLKVVIP